MNQLEDDAERLKTAQHLCAQYVARNAAKQVNVNDAQRKQVEAAVEAKQVDKLTFQAARREILSLMSKDSYKRFAATPAFTKLLEEVGSYETDTLDVVKEKRLDVDVAMSTARGHGISQGSDLPGSTTASQRSLSARMSTLADRLRSAAKKPLQKQPSVAENASEEF